MWLRTAYIGEICSLSPPGWVLVGSRFCGSSVHRSEGGDPMWQERGERLRVARLDSQDDKGAPYRGTADVRLLRAKAASKP